MMKTITYTASDTFDYKEQIQRRHGKDTYKNTKLKGLLRAKKILWEEVMATVAALSSNALVLDLKLSS